jgi:undecaprenyl pyrophosphate phosphatase UppP
MLTKKSPQADLEKKRAAFFQVGLIIALSSSLLAFEWMFPYLKKSRTSPSNTWRKNHPMYFTK